jgi:hypothetical protein
MRKDEKREVTPEFVNMSKEFLYPQIQGVTAVPRPSQADSDTSISTSQNVAEYQGRLHTNEQKQKLAE